MVTYSRKTTLRYPAWPSDEKDQRPNRRRQLSLRWRQRCLAIFLVVVFQNLPQRMIRMVAKAVGAAAVVFRGLMVGFAVGLALSLSLALVFWASS